MYSLVTAKEVLTASVLCKMEEKHFSSFINQYDDFLVTNGGNIQEIEVMTVWTAKP